VVICGIQADRNHTAIMGPTYCSYWPPATLWTCSIF